MHPGFGATHRCCEGHSSPFPPEQENATLNVDSAIDTRQRHDRIAPRAAPSSTLPRNTARLLKPGIPAATGRNEIPAHIKADRPHHLTTTERLSPPRNRVEARVDRGKLPGQRLAIPDLNGQAGHLAAPDGLTALGRPVTKRAA